MRYSYITGYRYITHFRNMINLLTDALLRYITQKDDQHLTNPVHILKPFTFYLVDTPSFIFNLSVSSKHSSYDMKVIQVIHPNAFKCGTNFHDSVLPIFLGKLIFFRLNDIVSKQNS